MQSKYRITDDDDETTRENRKRKELIEDVKPLIAMQQNIGWDNLLRGKLAREWRIYQRQYEKTRNKDRKDRRTRMKLEYGNVFNPYEDDKNKDKKNKNKSKDVFQNLIEQIFEITEKELWK